MQPLQDNLIYADMAELAVFHRAHPVGEEAKVKKAQRSKFIGVWSRNKFRKPQESRGARLLKYNLIYADMAELADALDSGSSEGNFVQVRFLLSAPKVQTL